MGLPGLALLIIATQALRARFGADVVVKMQPDAAVEITQKTVCLFVERSAGKPHGGFSEGENRVVLRVELFAPVDAPIGATSIAQLMHGSTALFFMWREVEAALAPTAGPWGELWERFRLDLDSDMYAMPLFETEKGVKIAGHVVQLTIDALASPRFGQPTAAWSALLTQMRAAGSELSSVADLIEASIAGGDMPAWVAVAASLGMSQDTLASIGLGPLGADLTQDEVPLSQVTVDDGDMQTVITPDD